MEQAIADYKALYGAVVDASALFAKATDVSLDDALVHHFNLINAGYLVARMVDGEPKLVVTESGEQALKAHRAGMN